MTPDSVPLYELAKLLARRRNSPQLPPHARPELEALLQELVTAIFHAENYARFSMRQCLKRRVLDQSRLHNWRQITIALKTLDSELLLDRLIRDADWRQKALDSRDLVRTVAEMSRLLAEEKG